MTAIASGAVLACYTAQAGAEIGGVLAALVYLRGVPAERHRDRFR